MRVIKWPSLLVIVNFCEEKNLCFEGLAESEFLHFCGKWLR